MDAITLSFKNVAGFSDDEFYQFCLDNVDLKLERTATGQIIIMPNTGGKTGDLNSELNFQLRGWNKQYLLGKVFDSSTAFLLPSGAVRSPDAAWVRRDHWDSLTEEQKTKFPPLCPDFVIELRSESDSLNEVIKKITDEWLANGCRLAWLIDPKEEKTYVFESGREMEVISGFNQTLTAADLLPGFALDLTQLQS